MTDYKYYLATGACIEYSLSPDSSLVETIDKIVNTHYRLTNSYLLDVVFVRPEIASALNRECTQKFSMMLGQLSGHGVLRLQTISGPVTIVTKPNLEIPIFFGSEQELEDNSFNASMEKILNE